MRGLCGGVLDPFCLCGRVQLCKLCPCRCAFFVSTMALGYVYFVFLPSMVTTPLAAVLTARLGVRPTFLLGTGIAVIGLLLLLIQVLGFSCWDWFWWLSGCSWPRGSRRPMWAASPQVDRASASGLYLASYYAGGIVGGLDCGAGVPGAGLTAAVGLLTICMLLVRRPWVALLVVERLHFLQYCSICWRTVSADPSGLHCDGRRQGASANGLRQVRYFLALSETLNFTRAADVCHITQPNADALDQKARRRNGWRIDPSGTRQHAPHTTG